MPLNSRWFTGVKSEDKTKREETVRNSRFIFDILVQIIEADLKELNADKDADYDNPSWAFKQAHNNGYRKAVTNFLKLLKDV